jgi:hypothetical protein
MITIPTPKSLVGSLTDYHIERTLGFIRAGLIASGREWAEADLGTLAYDALPIKIHDHRCAIDFNDWAIFSNVDLLGTVHTWYKTQATPPLLAAHPNLRPFPAESFIAWDRARERAERSRYDATGTSILAAQELYISNRDDRCHRRLYARGFLRYHFGYRADFELTDQAGFWDRVPDALCYLHIHGAWVGGLDKSITQAFGLGALVLTHPIQTCFGYRAPAPWAEYVPIEDPDLHDVPEKVAWIESHRDEARAIAAWAKARFWAVADPVRLWAGIINHEANS